MRLMDTTTDTEIMPGTVLRPVEPPRVAWRVESLHTTRDGVAMVHASRRSPAGRIHHVFHPHAFGLEIVVDVTITRREHLRNALTVVRSKVGDYMLAGIFALIPLAFFEYFHIADRLFRAIGMGEH